MREFQFTKRDDVNVQISVVVDIIDPKTQLFTIMDIRGPGFYFFLKYFPWNVGAVLHRSVLEKWYKDFSSLFIGIEYGDISGAKPMDGGGPVPPPPGDPDYLCFTANKAGATLRMIGGYTEGYENEFNLEYSTDGETWNEYEFTNNDGTSVGSTLTFNNIGDKVYFRGDNPKGTTDINALLQQEGYNFRFYGGEGTQTEDNQFAVSGDIQTLVSKDGSNKTAGCFYSLFSIMGDETYGIAISTPPSCSATSLSMCCYGSMFVKQESLLTPMDISNINIDSNNITSFIEMYRHCRFNMTSDNGVTLNGFGNIEYPITLNLGSEITFNNNFEFSKIVLVNIHGFNVATIYPRRSNGGNAASDGDYDYNTYWIPTNESSTATLTATPNEGYHFVKWQTSNDEGSTWVDIPDATNATYTVTLTQSGNYYYKAVFEQDQPQKTNVSVVFQEINGGYSIYKIHGTVSPQIGYASIQCTINESFIITAPEDVIDSDIPKHRSLSYNNVDVQAVDDVITITWTGDSYPSLNISYIED